MKLYEALYPEIKWKTVDKLEVIIMLSNMKYPEVRRTPKSKRISTWAILTTTTDPSIEHKWKYIMQQIDRSGVPYSECKSQNLGQAIRAPEWVFTAMKVYNGDSGQVVADMLLGEFLSRTHQGVSSGDLLGRAHLLKAK